MDRTGEKSMVTNDFDPSKVVGTTESILDSTLTCFQELEKLIEMKPDDGSPDVIRNIRECKSRLMNFCEELDEVETLISTVVKDVNKRGLIRLPPYTPPFSPHLHVPKPPLKKRKVSLKKP